MKTLRTVGARIPNVEGTMIVTGQANYASDIRLPGTLIGKILRSPHAHASIVSIDTSGAVSLPGVLAVVTSEHTPKIPYVYLGGVLSDRLPLAVDKVRFVGDEVAAVAAVDEETANRALGLIRVKYQLMPAVFDPEAAMEPDAPLIHSDKPGNIASHGVREFGDPNKAFSEAAVVVEGDYQTQAIQHCALEPFTCTALWSASGDLDMWVSTQAPFYVQKELGVVLGIDPNRIRVRRVQVSGGFGSRSKIAEVEAIAALLAKQVPGRPVRIALTRTEEFETRVVKVPMKIKLRTAADSQGHITGRVMTIISDNGAYNHCAPSVTAMAATMCNVLYRVPNVRTEYFTVYTNKQATAQMRGYGAPDGTFAVEMQMDQIAEELNIDALDLRLKNATLAGETLTNGWNVTSCGMQECLLKAAEAIDWRARRAQKEKGRGIGLSAFIFGTGGRWYQDGDYSSAIIRVGHDGVVTVETGAVEIGQWSNTTLLQVAAEVLGCDISQFRMVSMDTGRAPSDMGAFASRTAFLAGNAVMQAAYDVKGQLLRYASRLLDTETDLLDIADGSVVIKGEPPERCMPIGDLVLENPERIGRHIIGRGFWESPNTELFNRQTGYGNTCATYVFGAHAAEVEVDMETGSVRVLRVIAAHDVGRALNPLAVEGQIEGAIAQGVGFALIEQHRWKPNGEVATNQFESHGIPGAQDMPEIGTILVETDDPLGPFGAKSVGESGLVASPAAIANAIYDAIGVRMTSLPITPEKVLDSITGASPEMELGEPGRAGKLHEEI